LRLSRQYHKHRDEFWKVIVGPVIVEINGFTKTLQPGDTCEIPRQTIHRLTCPAGFINYAVVLEIATGDFDEQDIVRLEDDFSRHTIN
jgi:mannose-6-phosphate isomerase-like protein (cupin superfamily)